MIDISNIPKFDCDVLIVGAGPGGSALATYLAKNRANVILIDAQSFPRDKICGDFVSPLAILELQKLGIASIDKFPKTNVINRAALYLDGEEIINQHIPRVKGMPYYGRVIPRYILDEWIFRTAIKAKAKVLEKTRLTNFMVKPNYVEAEVSTNGEKKFINTKLIIGADGSNSTVARIFHGNKPSSFDKILAVRAYYEDINGPADQCDLYFTQESFPGYHWFFPTGNGKANVGVGMLMETLPKNDTHLKELLITLVKNDKGLSKRIGNGKLISKIEGFPLSTYNPHNEIIDDRLLLLGDAAGLINSLNGEGIQNALLSARRASETIINCIEENNYTKKALFSYDEFIKKELDYNLTLSNTVIQFIRNRTLNPIWIQLLGILIDRAKVDENYAEIAGSILAGIQPSNKAISPSFIMNSIYQGIVNISLNSVSGLIKGPQHWLKQGVNTAKFLKTITKEIQSNPKAYLEWIIKSAGNGVDISGHILKDVKYQIFNTNNN